MGSTCYILAMLVYTIVVLLSYTSYARCSSAITQHSPGRIVGGEEAPLHEFPWQISLRNLGSHICGGSIINSNQVITAAHCVEGALPVMDSVVAGAHHRLLEAGHQKRRIKSMEAHEEHNKPRFNNDVAIITVTEPFDFSDPNVQPIDMFSLDDAEIPAETVCNVTGWGLLYGDPFGRPPNALQWIQLPLVSAVDCADMFNGDATITDGMVCAGSNGHTTCNGDSGGPLVCPDEAGVGKLAGLVSFGHSGCTSAGVFTKVSFYQDWIQDRLQP